MSFESILSNALRNYYFSGLCFCLGKQSQLFCLLIVIHFVLNFVVVVESLQMLIYLNKWL